MIKDLVHSESDRLTVPYWIREWLSYALTKSITQLSHVTWLHDP